jgi:hypothetical protein
MPGLGLSAASTTAAPAATGAAATPAATRERHFPTAESLTLVLSKVACVISR